MKSSVLQVHMTCKMSCTLPRLTTSVSRLPSVPVSAPVIEKSPTQPVVEDKSNVTWTCAVRSGTRVRYQWLRDDVALAPSERHHFSRDNATLSISPVRKEDRGSYSCLATNPVSRGRYSTAKELSVYCKFVFCLRSSTTCHTTRWTGRTCRAANGDKVPLQH